MQKFGISAALLTPFTEGGAIDVPLLGSHARATLNGGADGVTLFGTTGEGASIAASERRVGIEALLHAGCPAQTITLGIVANAVGEAAAQVAEGLSYGITQFLLLPPFYFKNNSADGLFDWHQQLFRDTASNARFILYHIPQMSGVGLPVDLVQRLAVTDPDRVRAIKDSSGDWENVRALLALDSLEVLVGDERLLHRAVAIGAGGSICGMANFYPDRMKRICETAREDLALNEEIIRIISVPVVPALKAVMAARSGNTAWEYLRPPLVRLSEEAQKAVLAPGKTAA